MVVFLGGGGETAKGKSKTSPGVGEKKKPSLVPVEGKSKNGTYKGPECHVRRGKKTPCPIKASLSE